MSRWDSGEAVFTSKDGTVTGVLSLGPRGTCGVGILEWSSHVPGRGNTIRALREIRLRYGKIHAVGIGRSVDDPSWRYWTHMSSKGLIDSAEDDEGRIVIPPSGSTRRFR